MTTFVNGYLVSFEPNLSLLVGWLVRVVGRCQVGWFQVRSVSLWLNLTGCVSWVVVPWGLVGGLLFWLAVVQ